MAEVVTTIQPGQDVTIEEGRWSIKTTWPRVTHAGIDATILWLTDGEEYGTFQRRIRVNFLSDSKRDALARPLESNDKPARKSLRDFLGTVAEVLAQTEESEPATFVDTTEAPKPQEWVLKPFWPASGAVGLSAAPSSYKSFLILAAALQIATGKDVLSLGHPPTEPRSVLYLDWEDSADTFTRRLRALEVGAGIPHGRNVAYYRPRRGLSQSMEELQDQMSLIRPHAVVIDSMSAAIDGSMNDSDEVNAFWTAVNYLGVPAAVITHKSIENQRKRRAAFQGSGMSLARVRMAWNAEKVDNSAVRWECFKDNHGDTEGRKLAWRIKFHHDEETKSLGGVDVTAIDPRTIVMNTASDDERARGRQAVYDQILGVLEEAGVEGLKVGDISPKLHQTVATTGSRLSEMNKLELLDRERDGRGYRYFHPDVSGEQTAMPSPADLPDPFPV